MNGSDQTGMIQAGIVPAFIDYPKSVAEAGGK